MRILVLGGSGRTGRFLVSEALARGYGVNSLVRNRGKLLELLGDHKALQVFEGSPIYKDDLGRALEGCEAVVSALNVSRTSDLPWAKLRSPANLMSKSMENLRDLAKNQNLQRVVVCSAWGVGGSRKEIPFWFRWLIDYTNIGAAYRDHERQEEVLQGSGLNWIAVRPVGLTNEHKVTEVKISFRNKPKPSFTIPRKTVASFMVEQLKSDQYLKERPVISKE